MQICKEKYILGERWLGHTFTILSSSGGGEGGEDGGKVE